MPLHVPCQAVCSASIRIWVSRYTTFCTTTIDVFSRLTGWNATRTLTLSLNCFARTQTCQRSRPKQRVLLSLHLDYFYDYERRFGFRVVYNGPVATLMLFKNKQLRAFEQAVELWQCHHSFAPHGQILDLLSRWDHTRPSIEKLLIHLLFAEIPPAFHLGNFCNKNVVSLFEQTRISDYATYRRIEAIWKDFLRILFTF